MGLIGQSSGSEVPDILSDGALTIAMLAGRILEVCEPLDPTLFSKNICFSLQG
jgi:hypothetical protein